VIKSLAIYITITETLNLKVEQWKKVTACRFGREVKKRWWTSSKEKSPRG